MLSELRISPAEKLRIEDFFTAINGKCYSPIGVGIDRGEEEEEEKKVVTILFKGFKVFLWLIFIDISLILKICNVVEYEKLELCRVFNGHYMFH